MWKDERVHASERKLCAGLFRPFGRASGCPVLVIEPSQSDRRGCGEGRDTGLESFMRNTPWPHRTPSIARTLHIDNLVQQKCFSSNLFNPGWLLLRDRAETKPCSVVSSPCQRRDTADAVLLLLCCRRRGQGKEISRLRGQTGVCVFALRTAMHSSYRRLRALHVLLAGECVLRAACCQA